MVHGAALIVAGALIGSDTVFLIGEETEDKRVATSENQQYGCESQEDSDQSRYQFILIRGVNVSIKKARVVSYPLNA